MIFATYKFLISICSPILKNKIQPEHWGGGGQQSNELVIQLKKTTTIQKSYKSDQVNSRIES